MYLYFTKFQLPTLNWNSFSKDIIIVEGSVDNVNTATNDPAFIWVSSTKCGQDQKGFSSACLGCIVGKKMKNSAYKSSKYLPILSGIKKVCLFEGNTIYLTQDDSDVPGWHFSGFGRARA